LLRRRREAERLMAQAIGDAREQDVRDGEATAQRLLWLGHDPMMVQMMDHPVERAAMLLEVPLIGSDENYRSFSVGEQ